MKTLLTLLVSLSLAAGAVAQQDDAQAKKKHRKQQNQQQTGDQSGQAAPNQGHHGQTAPQTRNPHQGQNPQRSTQHNAQQTNRHNAPDAGSGTATDTTGNTAAHAQRHQKSANKDQTDTDAATTTGAAAGTDMNRNGKNRNGNTRDNGNASATAADTTTDNATTRTRRNTGAATAANESVKPHKGKGQKPDPQVVQQVKQQHVNFKAQPKPEKVPAVTYNQNYRINGSQNWQGTHYEVFRTYHPQWHDQGWYHTHYPRVQIIAGGAYYFNNGFWFPAWGYNPSYQYYAYDAPIYVGQSAEPPDRVIADVQAILQQQGYYKGEVDGLLGPLTREALTEYQTDNGLYATATIDEPTLSSLNLG